MPKIPDEVGPVYDCGIVSPTHGQQGFFIRPGTYRREQQLIRRQDVVAALDVAISDRDINFWTRVTQADWSQGAEQELFSNPARFRSSALLDVHKIGTLRLSPRSLARQVQAASILASGGVAVKSTLFFPWTAGNYTYSQTPLASPPTWATAAAPAGALIADVVTDGTDVFFCFHNNTGVWKTPAAAPAALAQHDAGATGPYSRLVYDPLQKKLYGITRPATAPRLEEVKPGAAPVVHKDFGTGRLDALEMYQGNVVVAWNSARVDEGTARSRLYRFDGTNVVALAEMPDGVQVIGLKGYLGVLYIAALVVDPFDVAGAVRLEIFYVVGTTGPGRLGQIDEAVTISFDSTSGAPLAQHVIFGLGSSAFFGAQDRFWRYDVALGGLSQALDQLGGNLVRGAAVVRDRVFVFATGAASDNGVHQVTATGAYVDSASAKLVGSRKDVGLPYVDKYWYAFEVVLDPLPSGGQVTMEFSLDDGATFTPCGGSPLTTAAAARKNFTVEKVNPHAIYRVGLRPDAAGAATPVLHAISARFAPSNPSAKMWRFTVMGYDAVRGRGNKVAEEYGKDYIDFLFNVAAKSETVTFYEPNDKDRTARTVWVMQAGQETLNTGGEYRPLRHEGDIDILLWEVT